MRTFIHVGRRALLFGMLSTALAQEPPQQDTTPLPDTDQPAPRSLSGIGITGSSIYITRLNTSTSGMRANSPWSQPIFAGGIETAGGWHAIGTSSAFTLDYRTSYQWNSVASELNGFNHDIEVGLRTGEGRRVQFAFGGTAEQRLFSSALFEPLGTLTLTRSASFSNVAQTLGEVRDQGTPVEPALDLWLFGRSVRRAAGHITMTFAQSRRLSWYSTVSADRTLPASGAVSSSASGILFPGVTSGAAAGGFQYSLSRRTSLGGTVGYGLSESTLIQTSSANSGLNVSHFFSERWFAYASAGYARMRQDQTALMATMQSYEGSAGLGASRGANTVVFLVHRGLTSRYGSGGMRSVAGELSWTWLPLASPWTAFASGNFQQLNGTGQRLQGWTGRFGAGRRLGGGLMLSFDTVYAGIDGRAFGSARALATRIAITWSPVNVWP